MKKEKLKLWEIIIIVIAVILLIFMGFTIRKVIILYNLENKIQSYINSENYYIKINNIQRKTTLESYVKDDKYLIKLNNVAENENRTITNYYNGESINTYIESGKDKIAILNSNGLPSKIEIVNWLYNDNIWQLFCMSIISSVKNEQVNGKECYKISNFYPISSLLSEGKVSVYIEKETGLLTKMINYNSSDKTNSITEYEYEFNTVTENNFKEPNIKEYKIQK